MATDDEIHSALLAIHSRLDVIEGKVTVVARADRDKLIEELQSVVEKDPIIGRIYLALDGKRNQDEIVKAVGSSKPAVSRWLKKMSRTHGMIELVPGREAGKIYRRDRQMEEVLDLANRVERWLSRLEKERAARTKGAR